ncbi:MAG TPA: alkaline phosphatase family protein, partial [Acidobacteriaceae bacterium]|nr:alkaline phosphatase family protein [Acidobacteriaceae bacterium]
MSAEGPGDVQESHQILVQAGFLRYWKTLMEMHRRLCSLMLASLLVSLPVAPARASAYDGKPKLVVLVVIDQFREDYLERYRADLKAPHGFRLFLDHGAYFPDCYYDYANTKTAPGHATLGTGAYTDGHGINSNTWWDLSRNTKRPVTAVEDERYKVVWLLNAGDETGASPRNERASTLGDELRLATVGQSKVFGISLKDRAAILPVGHSANAAYWVDAKSGAFVTSTYYQNALPDWATTFNASPRAQQALDEAHGDAKQSFFDQLDVSPAGNDYELDFARALITGEQLGHHPTTDMLTISLSANDGLGHRVGPDAPEMHTMVEQLDQQLDGFFTWLDQNVDGGLANVWIALSADHGVASTPEQAASLGMDSATWDIPKLLAGLNDAMNGKFSPGEKIDYLLSKQELPYIQLNQPSFERAGINEQEAEDAI